MIDWTVESNSENADSGQDGRQLVPLFWMSHPSCRTAIRTVSDGAREATRF